VLFGGNKNINYEDKDQKKKKNHRKKKSKKKNNGETEEERKKIYPSFLEKASEVE
jgi:hypothetical protein